MAVSVGAGLGFLAGLTGTGGGIFLTPLLLFCRWAHIRQAAAVSALFIWVNSIAGLIGYFTAVHSVPTLGIVLGALLAARVKEINFAVPVVSLVIFVVAAVIVGLLAAIFPARRASRLRPLEALSYE